MKNENKKGHPVLGALLGIVGVLIGLLGFLTVIIGGGIALLIGVVALILGNMAGKRGVVAIIAGVLAIVVAFVGALGGIGMVEKLREEAEQSGQAPMVAKYVGEKPYLGIMGVMMNLPEDAADLKAMVDEMKMLNNLDAAPETEARVKSDTTAGQPE